MIEEAKKFYTEKRGNCAQSIEHAWEKHTKDSSSEVNDFSNSGHGKSANGMCGALFAACEIVGDDKSGKVIEKFKKESGGHVLCRAIRSSKSLPCVECVGTAAEILMNEA